MAAKLDNLGYARVFRHPRTGELVVDTDSLRRPGGFSGVDFGHDPDDGDDWDDDDWDDDFEGDEFGDDFGDDLEGDDFGDDVEGDDFGDEVEGDDFGARGRRRKRRLKRRLGRLNRREDRVRSKLRQSRRSRRGRGRKSMSWGMTAVGGTDHIADDGGGAATVKVRLQHHFKAQDLTFTGSVAGSKVTSIFFGDRVVWSNSDGIDVGVFASTGFLRGLLKGQSLRAGLDVVINGNVPTAGDFSVTLIGQKPVDPRC